MKKAHATPPVQVCVKVERALVTRIESLIPELTRLLGRTAGRADVLRAAIVRGVKQLENERQ